MNMREIKFRAWDNVEDKMYYTGEESDIFFSFDSNGIVAAKIQDEPLEEIDSLDRLIYMQYTWLEDKNGKEIYEGDIVKYFKDELGVVKFLKNCFCIESNSDIEFMCDLAGKIEIVGNVYKNPEMISR